MSERCCKTLWKGSTWNPERVPCGNPAKFEEDGKHYCGIHNPARSRQREERWNQDRERDAARSILREAAPDLYAALKAVQAALKLWECVDPIVQVVDAALAKATGDGQARTEAKHGE